MSEKTWKLQVNEEELKALINHHKYQGDNFEVETSARIHDLTKRLNKKDEIEAIAEAKENDTW